MNSPVSAWWCVAGWCVATAVFVGAVALLGGPTANDANQSTISAWAFAHGEAACALPASPSPIAPIYPLLSGTIVFFGQIGHSVPFPSHSAMGSGCDRAYAAINQWSVHAGAVTSTMDVGYLAWLVLLAGVVLLLRASGRGQRRWEPVTAIAIACLPPVWMCVETYFHPQDLVALGISLAAIACALQERWACAAVLLVAAILTQQFAILVACPLLAIAPADKRVRFAGAAAVTAAILVIPLLIVSNGTAAPTILFGSGRDGTTAGGTALWYLHLHGPAQVVVIRLVPLALSLGIALWATMKMGNMVREPSMVVSLVAVSFSLRLLFEQSLFGYYFMALSVALVLLDVIGGRVRTLLVLWLLAVSLVFCSGPQSGDFFQQSWGATARDVFPIAVVYLVTPLIAWRSLRHHRYTEVAAAITLLLCALITWQHDPLSHHLDTWFWQITLVVPGVALGAAPLANRLRTNQSRIGTPQARSLAT